MPKMTVRFDGANELVRKFQGQPAIIQREADSIIMNTALRVETRAKQLAPVDTGYLKQHIKAEKILRWVLARWRHTHSCGRL